MKKYILLLIIPFLSFGQSADVDLLNGYSYYDEIHPRLSTFMNDIFITPDEKYIIILGGFRESELAIFDFKTFELVNRFSVPTYIWDIFYDGHSLFTTNEINIFSIWSRTREINLKSNTVSKISKKLLKQRLGYSDWYKLSFSDQELKRLILTTRQKHNLGIKSKIGIYNDFAFKMSTNSVTVLKYGVNHNENDGQVDNINTNNLTTNLEEDVNLNLQGDYYALIMGVNNYPSDDIESLDQPINDAEKLYDVLINYSFEPNKIKFLKNPTKDEIEIELEYLANTVTEQDNLLIFFAGHGHYDEDFNEGYWFPSDATRERRSWLPNSTIQTYLKGIGARNSLLIADACFGGSIFKTRSALTNLESEVTKELYYLPSCKAMTSGNMSEVPDKSVFIKYLIKRLNENKNKYLSSEQLFSSFKVAVMNNSSMQQIPLFGTVIEAGDEGGDFIFIKTE